MGYVQFVLGTSAHHDGQRRSAKGAVSVADSTARPWYSSQHHRFPSQGRRGAFTHSLVWCWSPSRTWPGLTWHLIKALVYAQLARASTLGLFHIFKSHSRSPILFSRVICRKKVGRCCSCLERAASIRRGHSLNKGVRAEKGDMRWAIYTLLYTHPYKKHFIINFGLFSK